MTSSLSSQRPTPFAVVDAFRLEENLRRMQEVCDEAKVELWPHVKTHKSVTIARRQIELGAVGLTCAKLSEAEAMLPSGVRKLFVAHSLVTPLALDRLAALDAQVDEVITAVTSVAHAEVLAALVELAGRSVRVALAVDTGLGREGVRTLEEAAALAALLKRHPLLKAVAIYTHEGHGYGASREELDALVGRVHARLLEFREVLGATLPLWPGCSVTASRMARMKGVRAVRPGAYVFGDLHLRDSSGTHRPDQIALAVRATVIDRPTPDLALIDAGSKTFSSDRTADGVTARALDGRHLAVTRLSEEHGFISGKDVNSLRIGDRIDWVPAHICPVVNLARALVVERDGILVGTWNVEAAGCNF